MTDTPTADLKRFVEEKYAHAARQAAAGGRSSCCDTTCCGPDAGDAITRDLYNPEEAGSVPESALAASLGCANPTALARLQPGEVVLDLGSGGGIDVLLSAQRVGPRGKVYGLDMTEDMLALARANQEKAGAGNVEFLRGDIEDVPLPRQSVDVVISNCVINLSTDKSRVLSEAFRVLRPGGRLAVADIVRRRDVPDAVRRSMELWTGCVAGALSIQEYRDTLAAAGFEDVEIELVRQYTAADARNHIETAGLDRDAMGPVADETFMSALVRARKRDLDPLDLLDP